MSAHLSPPPPPPSGPITPLRRPLLQDRRLVAVCTPSAQANPPGNRFYLTANNLLVADLRFTNPRGGLQFHDANFRNTFATICLETLPATPDKQFEKAHYKAKLTTIDDFNKLSYQGQVKFLDDLWDYCYQAEVPSTPAAGMFSPTKWSAGQGLGKTGSMPCSIAPVAHAAPTALEAGTGTDSWTRWQIGFRIEGGKGATTSRDDIVRVTKEGLVPLQMIPARAMELVGKSYFGHKSCRDENIFIGYQNRDIYNESAICLSRSLVGAAAFPYRDTVSANDGLQFHYLFAIKCTGLMGVDTEDVQLKMTGSLWRPGEKAFKRISKERVLAWVPILRTGGGKTVGWNFTFSDPKWRWINPPSSEEVQFLNQELGAWTKGFNYFIPVDYDFQKYSGLAN